MTIELHHATRSEIDPLDEHSPQVLKEMSRISSRSPYYAPYEYERYAAEYGDYATIRERLDTYGVVIIPGVLAGAEIESMISGAWDWVEETMRDTQQFTEQHISRDDPATWENFQNLMPLRSQLLKSWGVGVAPFMWDLRGNKRISDVFAELWKDPDLLVSFDGFSLLPPPEVTGIGWETPKQSSWLHCDQRYSINTLDAQQSWVTAQDVEEGDATLVVMEGSHKYHADLSREFGYESVDDDWHILKSRERRFLESRGCEVRKIKCPAGSLVLWDSRTVHCGSNPLRSRPSPNPRLVAYLCQTPRTMATPRRIATRLLAFEYGYTGNHCPHRSLWNAESAAGYTPPDLPPHVRRMVGFDE